MNTENRFCQKCGKLMEVTVIEDSFYDSLTGKRIEIYYHRWRCPDYRFFSGHQQYTDKDYE